MMKNNRKFVLGVIIALIVLALISLGIGAFSSLGFLESFRIIFGSVYVLFLPGFVLSYVFFPKTKEFESSDRNKGSIDWIERVALSFALSIAIVPLVVFYLNLIGVRINALNSFFSVLGIVAVGLGVIGYKRKR